MGTNVKKSMCIETNCLRHERFEISSFLQYRNIIFIYFWRFYGFVYSVLLFLVHFISF